MLQVPVCRVVSIDESYPRPGCLQGPGCQTYSRVSDLSRVSRVSDLFSSFFVQGVSRSRVSDLFSSFFPGCQTYFQAFSSRVSPGCQTYFQAFSGRPTHPTLRSETSTPRKVQHRLLTRPKPPLQFRRCFWAGRPCAATTLTFWGREDFRNRVGIIRVRVQTGSTDRSQKTRQLGKSPAILAQLAAANLIFGQSRIRQAGIDLTAKPAHFSDEGQTPSHRALRPLNSPLRMDPPLEFENRQHVRRTS